MPEWMLIALTYVLINILAPNATLSQGNRLQLTVCGALLGLVGMPLAQQLGNPSNEAALLPRVLVILLTLALFLIPALALLDGSQRPRLSVADGFLLGFLPAFGYDALYALTHTTKLGLVPPDARGYAWVCGLIALGWTAGYRLSLLEGHAQFWAFCAVVWAVFDKLSPAFYAKYMLTYHVLPWTALLLLFWMAWLESVWVRRSPGHRQLEGLNQLRVPGLAEALKHGPRGWIARERGLAIRTQMILERTEMLERGRTAMGEIPTAYRLDPVYHDVLGWLLRAAALAVGLKMATSGGLLYLGMGLVVLHYLRSTDLDLDEANSVVSKVGHQIALNGALFACVACVVLGLPELVLGIGLIALSLQDPLRRDWQLFLEPYQRRTSMLHRGLAIVLTGGLCAAAVLAYPSWLSLVRGLSAAVTRDPTMVHYTAALTMGCLLVILAVVGGKLSAMLEEGFDLGGRRASNR